MVRAAAKRADINDLAPHDLGRTCARLCHLAGGELEQIQFLLGHASVETTERYLGCKQKLSHAVNDNLGLEDTLAGHGPQADFGPGMVCGLSVNAHETTILGSTEKFPRRTAVPFQGLKL